LNNTPEETSALLQSLKTESKALTKEILEICWYMRGGISMDEAWSLTMEDRRIIRDIIQQNIDNTVKAKMPLM
jgi:hypothetical protein